jgi:DNA-binding LacI/PurR family transcriptional regulator
MICNSLYKYEKIYHFINDLIMRNAEGIILVSTDVPDKAIIRKMGDYLKVISVGQHTGTFDCVKLTDYQSAYALTEYMISAGHKKIAFLGYHPNASQTMERLDGYRQALLDFNITPEKEYILKTRNGYESTKRLISLPERPSAIITINDFYALGSYLAIEESGLKVGRDIAVAGFDDISVARFLEPALTTVRCSTAEMSKIATDLLFKNIDKGINGEAIEQILPSEVVIRQSVNKI